MLFRVESRKQSSGTKRSTLLEQCQKLTIIANINAVTGHPCTYNSDRRERGFQFILNTIEKRFIRHKAKKGKGAQRKALSTNSQRYFSPRVSGHILLETAEIVASLQKRIVKSEALNATSCNEQRNRSFTKWTIRGEFVSANNGNAKYRCF